VPKRGVGKGIAITVSDQQDASRAPHRHRKVVELTEEI